MSEKLSEHMHRVTKKMGGHTFTEGTWWESVAALEAKLEAAESALREISQCSIGQGVLAINIASEAIGVPGIDPNVSLADC
jgi:hypothetical protein